MRAVHLTKYGKPEEGLRLVEIAQPGEPKPGQILIRVEYAPINDSDMLVASGLYAVQPKLPSVVGNEGLAKYWRSVLACGLSGQATVSSSLVACSLGRRRC
jgi:NADPH:quinone reductase-like Zn-dependent oxidoreductase